jgi:hypothetical protein
VHPTPVVLASTEFLQSDAHGDGRLDLCSTTHEVDESSIFVPHVTGVDRAVEATLPQFVGLEGNVSARDTL